MTNRLRQIGGRRGHFIDQPRLHIHTDMFLVAVSIFHFPLTANPGLLIRGHLGEDLVVERVDLLWSSLVPFFPQRGFRDQMRGIHKGEGLLHQAGGFELLAHDGKELREPRRPNPSTNTGEQAIVGGGLG